MKKIMAVLFVVLIVPNISIAEDAYPKEVCKQIYESIGVFLSVADAAWKTEDYEKALLYSSAAANYATIYDTTCKR